jgi:hypothetical protein
MAKLQRGSRVMFFAFVVRGPTHEVERVVRPEPDHSCKVWSSVGAGRRKPAGRTSAAAPGL